MPIWVTKTVNTERLPQMSEPRNADHIELALTAYILSDVINDSSLETLRADEDLLEDGMVDSLGIMRLVAFIEQKFGFSVPAQDVTVENFMSVEAIVTYLTPKLGNGD